MGVRLASTKLFYLAKQKFADFIFVIFSFRSAWAYLGSQVLLNAFAWAWTVVIYRSTTEKTLILHYNTDFGISLIGEIGNIFFLPLGGFAINLINLLLAYSLIRYRRQGLLTHILFAGALTVNIFILIAISMLYLINFR